MRFVGLVGDAESDVGDLFAELDDFRPQAIGFSLKYLADAPEVKDLVKEIKRQAKEAFVFVGGHSASFVVPEHSLRDH